MLFHTRFLVVEQWNNGTWWNTMEHHGTFFTVVRSIVH